MARYKDYDPDQARLLPVSLRQQIQPGTIEYTINYLVDREIDLGVFDCRYRNDATGAPAIDPAVLLKIILLAYSRGIIRSRQIARACQENVVFMALSGDTRPHFTTIASFVSTMSEQIIPIFRDVLAVCYTEGLIGRNMFAVDGCKIASNCAKEWSGTKKELKKKAEKIEQSIRFLVESHRRADGGAPESAQRAKEERTIEKLQEKAAKIRRWLDSNPERIGSQGKPVKSNITDNESAKMPSSHGVIQGYNSVAVVDEKHQVVVDALVFGDGHEARHLSEVLDSVGQTFTALDDSVDVLHEVVLTADSGFHSEDSVKALLEGGVEAYVGGHKVSPARSAIRHTSAASSKEHRSES